MATRQIPKIEVEARERIGSRYAERLRKSGRLPAVIYGHKQEPVHVSVDQKTVTNLLHANTHLLEVVLGSKGQACLIKDVQWNHLGSTIVHLDLARVDLNERVRVPVAIQIIGDAVGLKEPGAILEHPISTVEVECLVTAIPEYIKVDVTDLKVGGVMTVKDLKLPAGVSATADEHTLIAAITVVKEEVVEVAAPVEGASAEPELIGKKPAEGEEAAAGEAGAKGAAPAKAAAPSGEKKAGDKK